MKSKKELQMKILIFDLLLFTTFYGKILRPIKKI